MNMRQLALLFCLPMSLLAVQPALAGGTTPGGIWSQDQTSVDDPYIPPPGSPDIAGDDGLGEGSSELNPGED